MNLRTLKKLSKRAAPLLPPLGDTRDQFRAERDDNYHGSVIAARKHWERSPCHPTHTGWGQQIVVTARAGHRYVLQPPHHPRKGTIMVGAIDGYYEPEWSEESAWDSLRNTVYAHFTDWSGERPEPLRDLSTPRLIFPAAADMVREVARA